MQSPRYHADEASIYQKLDLHRAVYVLAGCSNLLAALTTVCAFTELLVALHSFTNDLNG